MLPSTCLLLLEVLSADNGFECCSTDAVSWLSREFQNQFNHLHQNPPGNPALAPRDLSGAPPKLC